MGFGKCICKCILVIINIIFILVGLVLLAAGVLIKVGQQYVQPFIDDLLGQLPSISSGVNLANTASAPLDTQALIDQILAYADTIAIALIVFGVFMFIIGCLGCCGACCVVQCMLIIYAIVVLIILVVQVIVFALLMTGKFDANIRAELQKTIDQKYGGIDDFTAESILLNFLMVFFKCCGIDNYKDFNDAVSWNKQRSVTVSKVINGVTFTRTETITLATPVTCCKMNGEFPAVMPVDANCTFAPTDVNSNFNNGCWSSVGTFVEPYKLYIIIAGAGVMVFELLLAFLAIVLVRMKEKEKVGVI